MFQRSHEEAEALHAIPTDAHAAVFNTTARKPIDLTKASPFRLVEPVAFDRAVHPLVATDPKAAKTALLRRHVGMLQNSEGFLFPVVPAVDAQGNHVSGSYRIITRELSKSVFKPSDALLDAALQSNNVRVDDAGKRLFMLPSVYLIRSNVTSGPARGAAATLGTSAAAATAAGRKPRSSGASGSDQPSNHELASAFEASLGDRIREMSSAIGHIFSACRDSDPSAVPGAFLAVQCSVDDLDTIIKEDYLLPGGVIMCDESAQKRATMIGSVNKLALDVPVAKNFFQSAVRAGVDEEKIVDSGKVLPAAFAERTPLPETQPPMAFATPKPKSKSASSSSSSSSSSSQPAARAVVNSTEPTTPKRKPSAADNDNDNDTNKRAIGANSTEQLIAAIREKLTFLTEGPLSMTVHDLFTDAAPLGKWSPEPGSPKVPASFASGMQMADLIQQGGPNRDGLFRYMRKIAQQGLDGLDLSEKAMFGKLTTAELLGETGDPAIKSAMTRRIMSVFGLQFVAGLLHASLSSTIDANLRAVATDVMQPLMDQATESEMKVAALRQELDARAKQIETLETAVADARKKSDELANELEDVQKKLDDHASSAAAAAAVLDPRAPMKDEWNDDED